MIDKSKIEKLLKERKTIPVNDEIGAIEKAEDIFIALGNDEAEVYEFLKSADNDMLFWIEESYERLSEKFQSDRIDELFENM